MPIISLIDMNLIACTARVKKRNDTLNIKYCKPIVRTIKIIILLVFDYYKIINYNIRISELQIQQLLGCKMKEVN